MGKTRLFSGLAAGALSLVVAASAAATAVVVFPFTSVALSRTYGGTPDDILSRTVSGDIATFTLSGLDNATFSLYYGRVPELGALHQYNLNQSPLSASWNTAVYPDVTLWTTSAGGGLTVGSQPGDHGVNLFNLFRAAPQYGTGQVYDFGSLSVPEPASWTLMLIGLGGLGASLRRARARYAAAS